MSLRFMKARVYSIIDIPNTLTNGLGTKSVSGFSLVPYPAERMTAFN